MPVGIFQETEEKVELKTLNNLLKKTPVKGKQRRKKEGGGHVSVRQLWKERKNGQNWVRKALVTECSEMPPQQQAVPLETPSSSL